MFSQGGFFDEAVGLSRLSQLGDPLEKMAETVDFNQFRVTLQRLVTRHHHTTTGAGRPRWDVVLMFKILLLQSWNNLSDDKVEYLINDRLSFRRFLGLGLGDKVPDAKTIWEFRNLLGPDGTAELFAQFAAVLEDQGVITHTGSIVDATFVDAPRQRNTRSENQAIKAGHVPDDWQDETSTGRHHLAQKDVEARWAKKNQETHFGYKDHVKADAESKLIVCHDVTPANTHDSQEFVGLVDRSDRIVYADSAYGGEKIASAVREKAPRVDLKICEKATVNHPLTDEQKATNRVKSSTRCRIEHIFGHLTQAMGGITVRSIGLARASSWCDLRCLAYNLHRYVWLITHPRPAVA